MIREYMKSVGNQEGDHNNHICIQSYKHRAGSLAVLHKTDPLPN